jgi:hypothetical protein
MPQHMFSGEHECETAEHLALAQYGVAGEDVAHTIRKSLVVGHGHSATLLSSC